MQVVGTSNLMNTFHVFSSPMVKRPVVTLSFSHSLMRFWIASAEDTDFANLAFERVYSWPGYNYPGEGEGGRYVDFCVCRELSQNFI